MIQYWKLFEHLESQAKSSDYYHSPAWDKFNKSISSNGDVGIWHEFYASKSGQFKTIYI